MKTAIKIFSVLMLISSFNALSDDNHPQPEHYVPVGQQSPELRESAVIPKFNQTMEQVKELLGEPDSRNDVGKPVISRWYYVDKTVYFQDGRVIKTVVQGNDVQTIQPPH